MGEIPMPEVLDPDRPRLVAEENEGDPSARAETIDAAFHKATDYGQQLWRTLAEVRQYLLDSLPSDRRHPGGQDRLGAAPTGPDDDAGWDQWVSTYAMATSALAGPHGDSGYGLRLAEEEAANRRSAAEVRSQAERGRVEAAAEPTRPAARAAAAWEAIGKAAVGVVAAVVVIRGLGSRQRATRPADEADEADAS
jgi:hypothetical protein